MTLFKKCHACGKEVPEEHIGKCPHCDEQKGYMFIRVVNDFIKVEKDAMKKAYDEAVSKLDEETKLAKDKNIIKQIMMRKRALELNKEGLMNAAKKSAIQDFEEYSKKSETGGKFTFDAVLITEEQKKRLELEKKLEVQEKMDATLIRMDKTITKIHDRLSPRQTITIAIIVGICASFIGSLIFKLWTDLKP